MTEQERMMYDFLARISKTDAPIVFKGGLITKLILSESGFTDVQRTTKDIDANWIGNPPSMEELVNTISDSLGELQERFDVIPIRVYKQNTSAGISIIDRSTGDRLMSMDIDIKPSIGSRTYFWGEANIRGVLANEILADKICAISSDAVYKHRTKDIVDVYSLSHCSIINAKEIHETCLKTGRSMLSFEAFYKNHDDIRHAYDKLRGVEGKPDFESLYTYLLAFIEPFAISRFDDINWNSQRCHWERTDRTINQTVYPFSKEMILSSARSIRQKEQKEAKTKGKTANNDRSSNGIE